MKETSFLTPIVLSHMLSRLSFFVIWIWASRDPSVLILDSLYITSNTETRLGLYARLPIYILEWVTSSDGFAECDAAEAG
jgi:hypothetical protein